jgi:hypothetical protein
MKCTVYMTIFLLAETCSFCSHATEEDFTKRFDAGVVEGISLADQIRYCGFSFQTIGYFIVRDVCAPRFIPGLSFNREAKIYKKEIQEIAMLSNTAGFTRRLSDKYDRSFGNAWEGDTTNTVLIGGGILGGAIGLASAGASPLFDWIRVTGKNVEDLFNVAPKGKLATTWGKIKQL